MRDVWNSHQITTWDKAHTWHPFTQMQAWCADGHDPLVLVEGDGAILRDIHGREFLDGNSSIWTNIHGHRHPVITAAIKRQLDLVAHVSFLGTTNAPAAELAARLCGLFPAGTLTRAFFSDDGSTAVEAAIKMAVQFWQQTGHPERAKFVAFDHAYHGDTAGAASLGGIGTFTQRFAGHHFPVLRISSPSELDSLPEFQNGEIAAVIIEPLIQGAAGMRVWPKGLLHKLRQKCNAGDTLLILDEVLTGFGRTGTLFACEQENVVPDFLCLAKGLTGGYLPLAATLTTDRVFAAFLGGFEEQKTFYYGHSYTANPLGCAAAMASLDVFRDENVLENLQPKIARLTELLAGLKTNPHVWETRQCGFIAGIEVRHPDGTPFPWQNRTGARICEAARLHGLLTRPVLDTIVLMPPLCTSPEQLDSAASAISAAIKDVLG
ncbi:MAG: adenosylmethionine--8-amino-7-oxononanoate transaminase [Terrimicrobiaceae bacterium]